MAKREGSRQKRLCIRGAAPPGQIMAKKILDLDLNPKSFLSAGGRQRGERAKRVLGPDPNPRSFSAARGVQRGGSRHRGKVHGKKDFASGERPPLASSWQKIFWI